MRKATSAVFVFINKVLFLQGNERNHMLYVNLGDESYHFEKQNKINLSSTEKYTDP